MAKCVIIAALLFTADQASAFRAAQHEVAEDSLRPWNPANYKGGFQGFCGTHCEPDGSSCTLKKASKPVNWPKVNRLPVDRSILDGHCGSCSSSAAGCFYQETKQKKDSSKAARVLIEPVTVESEELNGAVRVAGLSDLLPVEQSVTVKDDVDDDAAAVAMETVENGGDNNDGDDDDMDDEVIESPMVTVKAQEAADECLKVLDKTDFNGDKVDNCCRTHWTSTLVSDLHGCVRSVLWHHYGKVVHHGRIVDKEEANHGFHKPEAHPETAKSQAPVVPEWTKTKLRHFEKEPDVPQPVVEAGPFAKFGAKKPQHVEPKNEPKVSQPSLSDAPVVTDAFAKFGAKKPQHVEPKGSQPSLSDDSVKADAFAKFGAKKRHVENKPEVPQPSLSDAPVVTDAFAKFGAERRPKSEPLADFVQPSGNSVKPESPGGPTGVKELRERFQRK